MSRMFNHLRQWPELYLGVPLATCTIPAACGFVYLITGHWPKENMDYLVDLAGRVQTAALIIVGASLAKQALGSWYTKKEKLENKWIATLGTLSNAFYLCLFAWLFTH